MGLFRRISDIISANLGELAEQYEDPEKMLKQAIREMGESIETATADAAKTIASEKRLQKELQNNEKDASRWSDRAVQAVESGDDTLAKKALARKKEHQKLILAIQDQLTSVTDASNTLRCQLEGMKAKLSEAKRNLATLSARSRAANVRKKAILESGDAQNTQLNDEAFQKFERMKEKVEMAEAEAEALAELRGEMKSDILESEVENTNSDDLDIEAELAELKRKANS